MTKGQLWQELGFDLDPSGHPFPNALNVARTLDLHPNLCNGAWAGNPSDKKQAYRILAFIQGRVGIPSVTLETVKVAMLVLQAGGLEYDGRKTKPAADDQDLI